MLTTGQRSWDFTDKRRHFWLLQTLGWCLMLLVAVGTFRSKVGALLPLILFRAVFGFLVTAFLLRPVLRRFKQR